MQASAPDVDPIEAVAARMDSIAAPLAEDDGVRRFNELYLAVTRAVADADENATFEGMNAHINHDLALITTTQEFGCGLDRGTSQHRDYVAVDTILQNVQDEIKDRFTIGIVKDIDTAGGRVDDMIASWSVSRARDNAWTQAQILGAFDGNDFLRKQFLLSLGRNVGFAGRGLLTPLQ